MRDLSKANDIVKELRLVLKGEAGERVAVSARQVVAQAWERYGNDLRTDDKENVWQLNDAEVPDDAWLLGNESILRSIFWNLISNACKAMSNGGTVAVQVHADAAHRVVVDSNGVGRVAAQTVSGLPGNLQIVATDFTGTTEQFNAVTGGVSEMAVPDVHSLAPQHHIQPKALFDSAVLDGDVGAWFGTRSDGPDPAAIKVITLVLGAVSVNVKIANRHVLDPVPDDADHVDVLLSSQIELGGQPHPLQDHIASVESDTSDGVGRSNVVAPFVKQYATAARGEGIDGIVDHDLVVGAVAHKIGRGLGRTGRIGRGNGDGSVHLLLQMIDEITTGIALLPK